MKILRHMTLIRFWKCSTVAVAMVKNHIFTVPV